MISRTVVAGVGALAHRLDRRVEDPLALVARHLAGVEATVAPWDRRVEIQRRSLREAQNV
jgi:hypothetical protein